MLCLLHLKETKAIIIARFGMLECGKNYKGTQREICNTCSLLDDENHRLNYCPKYRNINLCDSTVKVDFQDIYSRDHSVLKEMIKVISKVWNIRNANGTMNID